MLGNVPMNAGKVSASQVHPWQLAVGWLSGLIALFLFWRNSLLWGLAVAFVPPTATVLFVLQYADLQKCRESKLGKYFAQNMKPQVQVLRYGGYLVMVLGAWEHQSWIVASGLLILLFAWFRGVLFPP